MNEKVEAMIGNRDGKFFERFVPGLISAGFAVVIALGGQALGFWSDSRATDAQTASAITRLRDDLTAAKIQFEKETGELKRASDDDRKKTNELSADVKVILAIMQRIERKVDPR